MALRKRSMFLFYLLYAGLLTAALLVVRFPTGKLRQYCVRVAEQAMPGTICSIGHIGYDFPLSFRIHDIRVVRRGNPDDVLFFINALSMNIEPRQSSCRLLAQAYDGWHECRLIVKGDAITIGDIKIRRLDLGHWAALQRLLGRKIAGLLDVTGTYEGRLGALMAGEAKGAVTVREGSMELLQPILSLNEIHFQRIETEFHLRDQRVTIEKGRYQGAEFNGAFSGFLQMRETLGSSMLGVSGELMPLSLESVDPRWKNGATILQTRYKQAALPFAISGTLAGPLFHLGG